MSELKVNPENFRSTYGRMFTVLTQLDHEYGWPLRRHPWYEENSRSLLVNTDSFKHLLVKTHWNPPPFPCTAIIAAPLTPPSRTPPSSCADPV